MSRREKNFPSFFLNNFVHHSRLGEKEIRVSSAVEKSSTNFQTFNLFLSRLKHRTNSVTLYARSGHFLTFADSDKNWKCPGLIFIVPDASKSYKSHCVSALILEYLN